MNRPYQILDDLCARKPSDWSDLAPASKTIATPEVIDLLETLPQFALSETPFTDFDGIRPQRFLAVGSGQVYYVNTEGYSYSRYAFRLPKKLETWVLETAPRLDAEETVETLREKVRSQALTILALTAKVADLEKTKRGQDLMQTGLREMDKYSVSNPPDINLSLSTDDLRAGYLNQTDNE
jgi:hypothetical protein